MTDPTGVSQSSTPCRYDKGLEAVQVYQTLYGLNDRQYLNSSDQRFEPDRCRNSSVYHDLLFSYASVAFSSSVAESSVALEGA